MSERHFLEDVGKPYSTTPIGDATLWEVSNLPKDSSIPPVLYVVESEIGQHFLLGRGISGRPKFNMIRYIAKAFVQLFFEKLSGKRLCQYLILKGAYPFDLQHAFGIAPPYDLQLLSTGFIKLQRTLNKEKTDWEIQETNLIGEYEGDTWLIPETTIASGSTVAFFLRHAFQHHLPKQVYVFTACGSLEGVERIHRECIAVGVELIPVFSQCIFEVSKTGNLPNLPFTDLPILNPGSVTTKRFYQKALARYQETRMCSVGDVTESLEDPGQYSLRTLWEMQILGMDPKKENWDDWTVDVRQEKFGKGVAHFNPGLHDYFQEIWGDKKRD
jgi:hypothetical protein